VQSSIAQYCDVFIYKCTCLYNILYWYI
jgi:hypothetical protein